MILDIIDPYEGVPTIMRNLNDDNEMINKIYISK